MALHSKKEFAELCGWPTKTLSVYIGRAKVIVDEKGMVDDQNAINKGFLVKYGAKSSNKSSKAATPKESKSEKAKPDDGYIQTIRDKANADLENKMVLNDLKRLEYKKKLGQVVPTEQVKSLFVMHSENIKGAYVEASDNLIVIFANRGGMNATDISDMRKKFTDLVNSAVDKAIEGTKAAMKSLVMEFSEKRGVGQHD